MKISRKIMGAVTPLYREVGGLDNLIMLDEPALSAGMVKVALPGEDWENHPELTWQVWPDLLQEMPT